MCLLHPAPPPPMISSPPPESATLRLRLNRLDSGHTFNRRNLLLKSSSFPP